MGEKWGSGVGLYGLGRIGKRETFKNVRKIRKTVENLRKFAKNGRKCRGFD